MKAYKAGKAPHGFPGWPSKHVQDAHTSVVSGIQRKIDSLTASYKEQQSELSSDSSGAEVINSALSSYHSSQPSHIGTNSGSD